MRDPHRMRESIDLKLDNRQIVSFVIGALVVLGVVFALGVLVGKQLAVSSMPAPSAGDPLALIDAKEKVRAGGDAVTGTGELPPSKPDNLTFPAELTKTPKPGTSPVEPTRPSEPPSARGKPAEKSADKPSQSGAEKSAEKASDKSSQKAPEKTAEKAAEKPGEKGAEKPSAKVGDGPKTDDSAKRSEGLAAAFDKASGKPGGGAGQYCLQVVSTTSRDEADKLTSKLTAKGLSPYVIEADPAGKGHVFRVRVGAYATREDAEAARKALKKSGLSAIVTAAH